MPVPVQETLNATVASLQVATGLIDILQKLVPPGPPNFPQLQSIITLATSVQNAATQLATSGGSAGGGSGGTSPTSGST